MVHAQVYVLKLPILEKAAETIQRTYRGYRQRLAFEPYHLFLKLKFFLSRRFNALVRGFLARKHVREELARRRKLAEYRQRGKLLTYRIRQFYLEMAILRGTGYQLHRFSKKSIEIGHILPVIIGSNGLPVLLDTHDEGKNRFHVKRKIQGFSSPIFTNCIPKERENPKDHARRGNQGKRFDERDAIMCGESRLELRAQHSLLYEVFHRNCAPGAKQMDGTRFARLLKNSPGLTTSLSSNDSEPNPEKHQLSSEALKRLIVDGLESDLPTFFLERLPLDRALNTKPLEESRIDLALASFKQQNAKALHYSGFVKALVRLANERYKGLETHPIHGTTTKAGDDIISGVHVRLLALLIRHIFLHPSADGLIEDAEKVVDAYLHHAATVGGTLILVYGLLMAIFRESKVLRGCTNLWCSCGNKDLLLKCSQEKGSK